MAQCLDTSSRYSTTVTFFVYVAIVIIILCQLSHVIFQCEPFIIQIFMMSIRLIIVASFPDSGGALGMMLDYLYGCSFHH